MDGCGIQGHDDTCLCDVVIPHPTGWVTDAVAHMWMGEELVALRGHAPGNIWEDSTILDYLVDLAFLKDNWSEERLAVYSSQFASMEITEDMPWAARMRRIIKQATLQDKHRSIVDILDELGLDDTETSHVLFQSKRVMTRQELAEFQQDVVGQKYRNPHALGRKWGMAYHSAEGLASYWDVPFTGTKDRRDEQQKFMDELLLSSPNLSNEDIADMVNSKFQLVITDKTKVRARRHYVTHRRNNG